MTEEKYVKVERVFLDSLIQEVQDLTEEINDTVGKLRETCRQLRVTRRQRNRMMLDHGLRDSESARVGGEG